MIDVKKSKWKTYAFWIVLAEAVGALSGWLTRKGVRAYNATVQQPPLSPPSIVFPIVWAILFALMGIGAARVSLQPQGYHQGRGLNLMIIQLAVNFCWPLLFFNLRAYALSLLWLLMLLGLVIRMALEFYITDKPAAFAQIPYIIWLCFAAVLNDLVMQMR